MKEIIEKSIKEYSVFEKPLMLLGVLAGFIYLNGYLSEFDIPFPLEVGILPTLLVVIGVLSLLLMGFILGYIFLVGLINMYPYSAKFHVLINTDASGLYVQKLSNSIKFALIIYVIPFAVFVLCIGYLKIEFGALASSLVASGYVLWALVFSVALVRRSDEHGLKRLKSCFLMVLHILAVQFVSVVSLSVFLIIVIARSKDISEVEFLVIIISYVIVNFMCILPSFSTSKFTSLHESGAKHDFEHIIMKSQRHPTYYIMGMLLVFTLTPNISLYVGELPLKVLNIGGGMEMVLKDSRSQCDTWPEFVVEERGKDSCVSKRGKLIILLGSKGYFLFPQDGADVQVVGLDLGKASTIRDLPESNNISFARK